MRTKRSQKIHLPNLKAPNLRLVVDGEKKTRVAGGRTAIVATFLILSTVIHLSFLSFPSSAIFDEVHYGKALSHYRNGETRFTAHPAHSFLLMTAVAALTGFKGGGDFEAIGKPNDPKLMWQVRLGPALIGCVLPVLLFFLIEALGGSLAACSLGALAILCDNAVTIQTRTIALDGFLMFWIFSSLLVLLSAEKSSGRRAKIFLFLAGALGGMACGTKFTGVSSLVLGSLVLLLGLAPGAPKQTLRDRLTKIALLALGAGTTYFGGYWIYLHLMTANGDPGVFYVTNGSLLHDMYVLQRALIRSHTGLMESHPYGSEWWTWPLMLRPIYLWAGVQAQIYLIGNPVIWWGTGLLMAMVLVSTALSTDGKAKFAMTHSTWKKIIIPALGFATAYFPHILIHRVMFLYHYLPPMVFAVILSVLWMDDRGWLRPGSLRNQHWSIFALSLCLVASFVFFLPITLGIPAPDSYFNVIFSVFRR